MDKLERSVLALYHLTDPYKRYVDDVYAQTTNEAEADNFHNIINKAHPRIQFEIEKPTVILPQASPCHYLISRSQSQTTEKLNLNSIRRKLRCPSLCITNQLYLNEQNLTLYATKETELIIDVQHNLIKTNTSRNSRAYYSSTNVRTI